MNELDSAWAYGTISELEKDNAELVKALRDVSMFLANMRFYGRISEVLDSRKMEAYQKMQDKLRALLAKHESRDE